MRPAPILLEKVQKYDRKYLQFFDAYVILFQSNMDNRII